MFEIGEKVKWTHEGVEIVALFLEEVGERSKVKTIYRNKNVFVAEIEVETKLLSPYEGEINYSNSVSNSHKKALEEYQKTLKHL